MSKLTQAINGQNFYQAVRSGANQIIKNAPDLNRINVFPVADGDTGSNLSATVKSILDNMIHHEDIGIVAHSAADGALMGARGNSGMIFAQFFYAFAAEIKTSKHIQLHEFIRAAKVASQDLSAVLLNPVEGTLLTIIQQWALALERHQHQSTSLLDYANLILKDLHLALERTPNQLPILKSRGVVDSGAKGFYHFIEGVNEYIQHSVQGHDVEHSQSTIEQVNPKPWAADEQEYIDHHDLDLEHIKQGRYCCEALLLKNHSKLDRENLKSILSSFGNSLVMVGGNERTKFHLHTSNPDAFFNYLSSIGQIAYMKADDMLIQSLIISQSQERPQIAIVTDSIADLPQDFALDHKINVIPLRLIIEGTDYLDRIGMTPMRFYAINPNLSSQPSSSLPNAKQVETLYHFLLEHYEQVLVLTVSDKMSGTFSLLSSLAQRISDDRIKVVNTLKNSGAQGLLVMKAAQYIENAYARSSKLTLQDLVTYIENLRPSVNILVAVDNTRYLGRSGRVSMRASKIVERLGIKPIMTIDRNGNGKAYGASFTIKGTMKKIIKEVLKAHRKNPIDSYNIVHANRLDRAEHFAQLLTEALGFAPDYISEISPVVGAVAGEGAVAVSYASKGALS